MELQLVDNQEIRLNQEWLDEWIAYREEDLSKPMTPSAVKMLTNKLLKWSLDDQERLISNAIEMNWRGVYWVEPPKQPLATSTRNTTLQQDLSDTSWAG